MLRTDKRVVALVMAFGVGAVAVAAPPQRMMVARQKVVIGPAAKPSSVRLRANCVDANRKTPDSRYQYGAFDSQKATVTRSWTENGQAKTSQADFSQLLQTDPKQEGKVFRIMGNDEYSGVRLEVIKPEPGVTYEIDFSNSSLVGRDAADLEKEGFGNAAPLVKFVSAESKKLAAVEAKLGEWHKLYPPNSGLGSIVGHEHQLAVWDIATKGVSVDGFGAAVKGRFEALKGVSPVATYTRFSIADHGPVPVTQLDAVCGLGIEVETAPAAEVRQLERLAELKRERTKLAELVRTSAPAGGGRVPPPGAGAGGRAAPTAPAATTATTSPRRDASTRPTSGALTSNRRSTASSPA